MLIALENVSKRFSKKQGLALDSISFNVGDGEVVGFVGLNGAGKTTTIRILAGVALPTSGRATLDSHDIVGEKVEASRHVGWVPEFPNYDMGSTAMGLMVYFSGYYGIGSRVAKKQSQELLEQVGLAGSEHRKLRTYSQGMKKRFSLAAAMIAQPRNLLLDEILNGLDPEGVQFARSLMIKLRNSGKSILLSSHILTEVQELSDRVIFIHHGRIAKVLTRNEITNRGAGLEDEFFRIINQEEGKATATIGS